jgi:hypothetical protein
LAQFRQTQTDGSPWQWLNIVSDLSVAAAFGKLFWPDLIERDGVVLAKLWSLRAAEQFGAGRVIVDVLDGEPPGTDPVILVHQDI